MHVFVFNKRHIICIQLQYLQHARAIKQIVFFYICIFEYTTSHADEYMHRVHHYAVGSKKNSTIYTIYNDDDGDNFIKSIKLARTNIYSS